MTQQPQTLAINPPQLPQQGGTIATTQTTPGHAGPTGDMQFSIPLPVSGGRGFALSLALSYQTTQGNGPFGVGWQLPLLSIRLHTKHGTPKYDDTDRYVGPSGEVLEPVRGDTNNIITEVFSSFRHRTFEDHIVTSYRSRVAGGYERYERWQLASNQTEVFWLVFSSDGSVHCLGKSPEAQTSDKGRIAEWSVEESLSPQGEHIRYVYTAENDVNVDKTQSSEQNRSRGALSYLTKVLYGNVEADAELYCLSKWPDDKTGWLFSLVLDYGQPDPDSNLLTAWSDDGEWLLRQDSFSDYHYGFEVRCHRLCHQVLMFHHFPDELTPEPMLIRRLLLSYDENPMLSRLISAQEWAYGEDSEQTAISESRPALQIRYQEFSLPELAPQWQALLSTPGINESSFYQLVDLYGEGLPGVLYRSGTDWRYRAPQRGPKGGDDITYSDWESVAAVPSLQDGKQVLTDITGNGRLDWMVTQPGLNGFFTLKDDKTWQSFTPFSAVPSELLSGEGMFADITGAGLSDVAVIGPSSVRFYPNIRTGFASAQQTKLDSLSLPIQGRNGRTVVAFSDMLGAGQAQLVEIDQDRVSCWPNLGHGQFGECIRLSWNWNGQSDEYFQPQRLYLVDIDGSGANDLIYVRTDKLTVYLNMSGNGFAEGQDIDLPEGVHYDDTCQLTFNDLQGTGGLSVLFSVPHMAPTHYVLSLSQLKPHLLCQLDNQCGAVSEVVYRHTGQEWLDEKANSPEADCKLPIALYLVKEMIQTDKITGNQLTQHYTYRNGLYDPDEREYRGFGYVETLDTQVLSSPSQGTDTSPLKTCRWYNVGQLLPQVTPYWNGDCAAYELQDTRLKGWDTALSKSELWWQQRALSGSLLREEVYGLDSSELKAMPYSVQTMRYQVTQLQKGETDNSTPTLRVQLIEQLSYNYERISADPSCGHVLTLTFDEHGLPTQQVSVSYPRRKSISDNTWDPIYLGACAVSVDEQQYTIRINESLSAYQHRVTDHYSVVGLAYENRSNVIDGTSLTVPNKGLSVEALATFLLGSTRIFTGQQTIHYIADTGPDDFLYPPRVAYVEIAAFDSVTLEAYRSLPASIDLDGELTKAGYVSASKVLSQETDDEVEDPVWVVPQSYTRYLEAEDFYLPTASRTTTLVGESLVTYDAYNLAVTATTDPLKNVTIVTVDYQQVVPHTVVDINKNTQQVAISPLGAPVMSSFYGMEDGERTGFNELNDSITSPLTVEELIAAAGSTDKQEQASIFARNEFSWQLSSLPLHQVASVADNYPKADSQQRQLQLSYSDGFGRALQSLQKVSPGLAYQRTSDGNLKVDENDKLIEISTDNRWRVSGRVEYNNKGLVVRQYQPYFVDGWEYVADKDMRAKGYADTHYYDALGRLIRVETANGFERCQFYTPWFTVAEDENDTLHKVRDIE